jgi:hypothetical protein
MQFDEDGAARETWPGGRCMRRSLAAARDHALGWNSDPPIGCVWYTTAGPDQAANRGTQSSPTRNVAVAILESDVAAETAFALYAF